LKKNNKSNHFWPPIWENLYQGYVKRCAYKTNSPTVPTFKITGTIDVTAAKAEWICLLEEHATKKSAGFIHPFLAN